LRTASISHAASMDDIVPVSRGFYYGGLVHCHGSHRCVRAPLCPSGHMFATIPILQHYDPANCLSRRSILLQHHCHKGRDGKGVLDNLARTQDQTSEHRARQRLEERAKRYPL
jgi:hypothetical protein